MDFNQQQQSLSGDVIFSQLGEHPESLDIEEALDSASKEFSGTHSTFVNYVAFTRADEFEEEEDISELFDESLNKYFLDSQNSIFGILIAGVALCRASDPETVGMDHAEQYINDWLAEYIYEPNHGFSEELHKQNLNEKLFKEDVVSALRSLLEEGDCEFKLDDQKPYFSVHQSEDSFIHHSKPSRPMGPNPFGPGGEFFKDDLLSSSLDF